VIAPFSIGRSLVGVDSLGSWVSVSAHPVCSYPDSTDVASHPVASPVAGLICVAEQLTRRWSRRRKVSSAAFKDSCCRSITLSDR
jgi:hypothetical protein